MEKRRFLIDGAKWTAYVALAACTKPFSPDKSPTPTPKEISGFPPGIWRFNGGPHDDPLPERKEGEPTPPPRVEVWYAIDIGIPELLGCGVEPNFYSGLKYKFGAVRAGKIILIERVNGIIRIKDERGKIWHYAHLEIDEKLEVDQDITLYGNLGTISCRGPRVKGIPSGPHVHIGIGEEVNGHFEKRPIDGEKIGDWTVRKGDSAYNGTLTNKETGEVLIADTNICFPTKQNPAPCRRDSKGRIITNEIRTPKR